MDESSSKPYIDINNLRFVIRQILTRKRLLNVRDIVDKVGNWLADNVRSFYLLPDSLELMLYICVAVYIASKLAQQA
jgi:hypothetical protein